MLDKRVFSRYKVNFECRFVLESELRVFEARLLDLNLKGMRLLVYKPPALKPGQKIQFSFASKPPVKGRARVVWVKKLKKGLLSGLEIIELVPKFAEALQQIIKELTLLNLSDAYFR